MGLSSLGIFHTIIGIIAIVAAIIGFVKYGKINLGVCSGKIYYYFTLVTSLTALGLSKHGGFNPGHILALLVILAILLGAFLYYKKQNSLSAKYWENLSFSFSFFLSMIPTINETLTRVPIGHPFAYGPDDPFVKKALMILLLIFIVGSVIQFIRQYRLNKSNS